MKYIKWIFIGIIVLLLGGCGESESVSDNESSHPLKIGRGAYMYIYDSVSVRAIDRAIGFVEQKEIDSEEYGYVFVNSQHSFFNMWLYDLATYANDNDYDNNFVYYVAQLYNGVYTGGFYMIDEDGKIHGESGIMDDDMLANVDMTVDFSAYKGFQKVNEIRKTNYDFSYVRCILTIKQVENGDYVCCYYYLFDDYTSVYLDAKSGEIVE